MSEIVERARQLEQALKAKPLTGAAITVRDMTTYIEHLERVAEAAQAFIEDRAG